MTDVAQAGRTWTVAPQRQQRPLINFYGMKVEVGADLLENWELLASEADDRLTWWVGVWERDHPSAWTCTVTDTMLSALADEKIGTDADVEFRSDALIGLVMQLVSALAAGSEITVGAVISAARAAFPGTIDTDVIARIGAAGMCVMWAQSRAWFDAHRHEFGQWVLAASAIGAVYRPNAFRGLA